MKPLTARWIFCSGLCFLAACAVLPERVIVAVEAPVAATPEMTAPATLAKVVRERAEFSSLYGEGPPAMIQAAAAAASLRETLLAAEPGQCHRDRLRALGGELADARQSQRTCAGRDGEQPPAMRRADSAARGLTAASNAGVRAAG